MVVVLLYAIRCVAALGVPMVVGTSTGHTMAGVAAAIVAFGSVLVGPIDPRDEPRTQGAVAALVTAAMLVIGSVVIDIRWLAIIALAALAFTVSLVPAAELRHERSWFYTTFVLLAGMAFESLWPQFPELVPAVVLGAVWAMVLLWAVVPFHISHRTAHRRRTELLYDGASGGVLTYRSAVIAAVCAGCLSLSFAIGDEHVGWITIAALATLQPDPRGLAPRLIDRIAGSVIGAGGAWLILNSIGPSEARLLVALTLAGLAAWSRLHHYRVYVALITMFVLTMSGFVTSHEGQLAVDRVLDTFIGATAAAAVYWIAMGARRRSRFDAVLAQARHRQHVLRSDGPDR